MQHKKSRNFSNFPPQPSLQNQYNFFKQNTYNSIFNHASRRYFDSNNHGLSTTRRPRWQSPTLVQITTGLQVQNVLVYSRDSYSLEIKELEFVKGKSNVTESRTAVQWLIKTIQTNRQASIRASLRELQHIIMFSLVFTTQQCQNRPRRRDTGCRCMEDLHGVVYHIAR